MFYMKKLTKMIFSIFLIGTLSFLLLEMIPGDPASAILGVESTPEDIELLREALGLNKSEISHLGQRSTCRRFWKFFQVLRTCCQPHSQKASSYFRNSYDFDRDSILSICTPIFFAI